MQDIDYEKYNPFRQPDWRLYRVLKIVDRPPAPNGRKIIGRTTRRDDMQIKALRNFVLRYRNAEPIARNTLAYENPGLFWAYQVYERREDLNDRTAEIIEARILARQSDAEIAAELHTLPEVILWYESLFFNVRDRLDAYDWIVAKVLVPAWQRRPPITLGISDTTAHTVSYKPIAEPFFDATLKMFAYFGGPYVLDAVLTGYRRGLVAAGRDDVTAWFDTQYMARLKQRSAMAAGTFEVNRFNVMQLFELHNQIITIERNAENEQQQQGMIQKAIAGMMQDIRCAVGKEGADMVKGTPLEEYDTGAAELRDNEMLRLSAGEIPGTIEGVAQLTLPAPRQRVEQEVSHADAQQGS